MAGSRNRAAQLERERIRAQRVQEVTARAAAKEAMRRERERLKQLKADAERQGEAEAGQLNKELDQRYTALQTILETGIDRDTRINFELLKNRTPPQPFVEPPHLAHPAPEPVLETFMPPPITFFRKLFGKQKYDQAVAGGQRAYDEACRRWKETEQRRQFELQQMYAQYEQHVREYAEWQAHQHREVDEFQRRYVAGEPAAIASYCELVLTISLYPDGFPSEFRLAYVPDSKQVVVEYRLPPFDVIPEESEFRYVKSRDEIAWSTAKLSERRSLYAEVVGSIAIRSIHELYAADVGGHVDVVVFNGFVRTIDPGTGSNIQPHLITARATRDEMAGLDLRRVEPLACLRHLKAQVSRSPSELQPVRPIIDFNMVDPRFIEHGDVLAELDERPNLMEMTPGEFETLVTNLFEKMGLETRLTQASRDGGVDCVAYDQRPILGGKVVIQAKRYKHTVGVSAVRDLFGTMHNEGANKGILVTTSDYGKAAFDFANGKPIELINGSNLLYLLNEQGVNARIEMPTDWQDPAEDG